MVCFCSHCAQLTEQKFQKLIKSVDLNGNGTIEFDEYCWMVRPFLIILCVKINLNML